jgi:hypothetical protein
VTTLLFEVALILAGIAVRVALDRLAGERGC